VISKFIAFIEAEFYLPQIYRHIDRFLLYCVGEAYSASLELPQ